MLVLILSLCGCSCIRWAARARVPKMTSSARYALGVDVGTGSARAGVVDVASGALCGVHKQDIVMFHPLSEYYEQSSEDIWGAVCACVKAALSHAHVRPEDVCGIAFDATCSLVLLDGRGQPVGADPTLPDEAERNVIVWMDHRAEEQVSPLSLDYTARGLWSVSRAHLEYLGLLYPADLRRFQAARINAGGHPRLANVGGIISPEMEIPKLLWLKENMPRAFEAVAGPGANGKAMDLSDFLAYKATDGKAHARSLCTTVMAALQSALGGWAWTRTRANPVRVL